MGLGLGIAAWLIRMVSPGPGFPVPTDQGARDEIAAAQQAVEGLTVRTGTDAPDYSRDQFGQRWADTDHNGCDTRNDVLAAQLDDVGYRSGSDCVVISGTLHDPYTGQDIAFTKQDAAQVQIDHIVSLADAWYSGAWAWNPEARLAYANDAELVLWAVDGDANTAKGDKTADEWLPDNENFVCSYVARQVLIKDRYALSVTADELGTLREVLEGCRA